MIVIVPTCGHAMKAIRKHGGSIRSLRCKDKQFLWVEQLEYITLWQPVVGLLRLIKEASGSKKEFYRYKLFQSKQTNKGQRI